jgi:hypothetical protein
MKKNTSLFYLSITVFIVFLFANCSGGAKEKEKIAADSIARAKVVADSIQKIEDAKPKFLVIQGTNVNLRVEPNTKAIRIKQLKTNDTCEIIEKSKIDTINDVADYWYKIRFKKKEGWVFGEFTSLKLKEENLEKPKTFIPKKSN